MSHHEPDDLNTRCIGNIVACNRIKYHSKGVDTPLGWQCIYCNTALRPTRVGIGGDWKDHYPMPPHDANFFGPMWKHSPKHEEA